MADLLRGLVSRFLPQPQADNAQDVVRISRYREVDVVPRVTKQHPLADEGSYYVANNSQTGILIPAATAFLATTPALVVANTDSPGNASAKRIYLDYVSLDLSAVGSVTSPALAAAVVLDVGNRYASGGTALTPVMPNMDLGPKSVAQVFFGAVTATAATASARTAVGQRYLLAGVAYAVGDSWVLNFGGVAENRAAFIGTPPVPSGFVIPLPPVIVGPGQSALVYLWEPGSTVTTAPSMLPDVGWWER